MTISARTARISLLALGAGSIVTQIVLLREVLATFAGNELTAATALGLWLVCTGLGSLLGTRFVGTSRLSACSGRPARVFLGTTHLALAVLPLAMLAGLRAYPTLVGVRGSALGLPTALAGNLGLFLPYGLLAGGTLPLLGRLASADSSCLRSGGNGGGTRWAYALDSLGSAGGGLLLGIGLMAGLPHGWCLSLAGLPHLSMAAIYLVGTTGRGTESDSQITLVSGARPFSGTRLLSGTSLHSRTRLVSGTSLHPLTRLVSHTILHSRTRLTCGIVTGLGFGLCTAGVLTDRATRAWRHPGQEVLQVRDTPFGQLAVTRSGTQRNLLQDAIVLFSTGDLSAESRVHPALCQAPVGATVLLIGGSIAGSLPAAMLHQPRRVDCVEIDPAIFRLGHSAGSAEPAAFPEPLLEAPVVHAISADGREFIRGRQNEYDVILLHLPGPENAQLNRFYTVEFYREVRAALRPEGFLSFLLPSSPNYVGDEQLALERSIAAALRRSFPEVTILPGESHLFLASDRPADLQLEPILAARRIVTGRLLDYDWDEMSDPFRRDELQRLLLPSDFSPGVVATGTTARIPAGADRSPAIRVNQDLVPAAFRHWLDLQARLDAGGARLVQMLIAVSILAALWACVPGRRRADATPFWVLFAVATSGFAAMALELAILLAFQVIFGNLYLRLSFLVTLFLGGTAIGALASPRLGGSARGQIRFCDIALVISAIAIGWAAVLGTGVHPVAAWIAGHLLLPALALLAAVPIGIQFAAAGRVTSGATESLGRLYLADLAGAASGTMVASLWLLPRGGVVAVIAAVAALKIAGLAVRLVAGPVARRA